MKKENLVHHIKVIYTQEKDKLHCNWCGKTYQSEHSNRNHYKLHKNEEEEITPEIMLEAEMMVRAQTQSLIQGLNTPIPTMFPEGEGRGLSQNNQKKVSWSEVKLFGVDCLGRVDYTKEGGYLAKRGGL